MNETRTSIEVVGVEFLRWLYENKEQFFATSNEAEISSILINEGFMKWELYNKEKHICNGAQEGDILYIFTEKFFNTTGVRKDENAVVI